MAGVRRNTLNFQNLERGIQLKKKPDIQMLAGGAMTEDAREFALRLQGFATAGVQAVGAADVANAFLAVAVGVAMRHMAPESVAGWLRACAEEVERDA